MAAVAALLGGCAHDLPQAGPSTAEIVKSSTANPKKPNADYVVITLDSRVAAALPRAGNPSLMASFGDEPAESEIRINPGDYVSRHLLGSWLDDLAAGFGQLVRHRDDRDAVQPCTITSPEQIVGPDDGAIEVPFAGRIHVAGMTHRRGRQGDPGGSARHRLRSPGAGRNHSGHLQPSHRDR